MFDPASISSSLRRTADALAARIEDAALAVAQPSQQSYYDGWLLRYSPGKARRARSVNAIGAGILPLPEKLAHCIDFYTHRRLPCLFRVTPFSQPAGLDDELAAAGFGAYGDTRVMKLALAETTFAVPPSAARSISAEQFATAFGALHELDTEKTRAERERYTRSAAHGVFVAQFDGDAPIACGSVAIDGKLAGIFGMVTATCQRRRGIATSLLAQLLDEARAAGAQTAYLQVDAGKTAARRTYSKFGFDD